jgi:hypothetical protein
MENCDHVKNKKKSLTSPSKPLLFVVPQHFPVRTKAQNSWVITTTVKRKYAIRRKGTALFS